MRMALRDSLSKDTARPYWGFKITAEGPINIRFGKYGAQSPEITIMYSTDGVKWYNLGMPEQGYFGEAIRLRHGEFVYLKAGNNGNATMGSNVGTNRIVIDSEAQGARGLIGGNIMSLLNGESETYTLGVYALTNLFQGRESPSEIDLDPTNPLVLPATTLGIGCYYSMFLNTSITRAPALPATALADCCYCFMFKSCAQLASAPELPAEIMAEGCYREMFNGCTRLASAPDLPIAQLARTCCDGMFSRCLSLEKSPAIGKAGSPINVGGVTSATNEFVGMFAGCSAMNEITAHFTTTNSNWDLGAWVQGVAASGTFRCPSALGTNSTIIRGVDNCPAGWTVVNTDA